MKANAIIRIILWSIVIVFLLSTLGGALLYRTNRRWNSQEVTASLETAIPEPTIADDRAEDRSVSAPNEAASDADRPTYTANADAKSFPADAVRKLNIEWAAGTITILADATANGIQITEVSGGSNRYETVYKQSGNTLTIAFSRESIRTFGFTAGKSDHKDLTILVPHDWVCQELELDVADANLKLQDLTIREMDFDGASGTCEFEGCNVEYLDMDTASGDIHFSGTLGTLDLDAASASFYGKLSSTPNAIEMDSMSGSLELSLPEDTGFTVNMDGMHSQFYSDFQTTARDRSYVYGDGRCKISVDAMSGDVTILKNK